MDLIPRTPVLLAPVPTVVPWAWPLAGTRLAPVRPASLLPRAPAAPFPVVEVPPALLETALVALVIEKGDTRGAPLAFGVPTIDALGVPTVGVLVAPAANALDAAREDALGVPGVATLVECRPWALLFADGT